MVIFMLDKFEFLNNCEDYGKKVILFFEVKVILKKNIYRV